jgi:hypothetical protein
MGGCGRKRRVRGKKNTEIPATTALGTHYASLLLSIENALFDQWPMLLFHRYKIFLLLLEHQEIGQMILGISPIPMTLFDFYRVTHFVLGSGFARTLGRWRSGSALLPYHRQKGVKADNIPKILLCNSKYDLHILCVFIC